MVGRDFAEVLVGEDVSDRAIRGDDNVRQTREEVVRHLLAGTGTLPCRVEEREAVLHAVRRSTEAEQVLVVVGQAVVVGIVVRTVLGDAEQVLPPVGQVVAVFVGVDRVFGIDRAVGLHAAVDVDDIRLAGGDLRAVVVDERIPADRRRGIEILRIVVARVVLPPVGDAVAVRVVARLLPRIGRAVVPHLLARLREGAAHRDEIRRADKAVPDLEPAHGLVRAEALALALNEDVGVGEAVVAVFVEDGRRIGHRGVREHELRHAEVGGGHVDRSEVVAVHEAVYGTAVDERQVAHGVLDPRDDVVVVVDSRFYTALVPPANEQVALDAATRNALEIKEVRVERRYVARVGIAGVVAHRGIQYVLREARRSLRDVAFVDRTGERREVVVEDELRRKRRVAVVVVSAAIVVEPRLEDGVAILGRLGEAQRLHVVLADLVASPRAVPDAHFIDVALEVLLQVAEILFVLPGLDVVREEGVDVLLLRPCADQERARRAAVLAVQEAVCCGRVLVDKRHAVRRHERGRRRVLEKSVDVDDELGAVKGERDVRPLVERQRAAVDELAALRRVKPRLDRVVVVEHAVDLALRIEADAEVRAYCERIGVHRIAFVGDGAVDDRLRDARLLGHHPALDRELLEEVAGVHRPDLQVARDRVRIVAGQVERLATGRIVEPERIGRSANRRYDLHLVGRHVAVGVVAFVLLEAELVADESAEVYVAGGVGHGLKRGFFVVVIRRADPRHAAVGKGGRHDVVLRDKAGRRRALGEPQRRRIGMARHRVCNIGQKPFVVVSHAVAVGVSHWRAHAPGIEDGIVRLRRLQRVARQAAGAAERTRIRRVYPLVVPGVESGPRVGRNGILDVELRGNYVAELQHAATGSQSPACRLGSRGRRTEKRVEAVVHLVEIVHAVAVGIGDARVGRRVARNGVAVFGLETETNHRVVAVVSKRYRVQVLRIVELIAGQCTIPRIERRREIAGLPPTLFRPGVLQRGVAAANPVRDKRSAVGEPLLLRRVVDVVRLGDAGADGLDHLLHAGRDRFIVDKGPAVPRLGGIRGESRRIGGIKHGIARAGAAGRGEPEALRMITLAPGELAAHERRRDVVVAEVADGLRQVLLVVLESVVVEVDVALRLQERVPR